VSLPGYERQDWLLSACLQPVAPRIPYASLAFTVPFRQVSTTVTPAMLRAVHCCVLRFFLKKSAVNPRNRQNTGVHLALVFLPEKLAG